MLDSQSNRQLAHKRFPFGACASPKREVRDLIFRMVVENRTRGAPRIHVDLKMPGFRDFGTNNAPMGAESSEGSGAGETVGGFLEQSSGSNCGHGLLLSAEAHLRRAVLLLRDRA